MTRTPLKRHAPLRPGSPPPRRTAMKAMSPRARARRRTWAAVTARAIAKSGGRCEFGIAGVCTGRAAEGHHLLPRSQGGADTLDNAAAVCRRCHAWVTEHPAWAYERGFLRRREVTRND
jgi:5-methylcytosine-specific restriction endonuclease McrA